MTILRRLASLSVISLAAAILLLLSSPDRDTAGAAVLADLSVVSEVQAPVPAVLPPQPGPAGAVHHEISIPEGCPEDPAVPNNGDGDGDGNADDRQLDINGGAAGKAQQAPNGAVELWCIDPSLGPPVTGYYALQFDPVGGAGPRFIGKCPFEGGWNSGWKFINPRTGFIQQIQWESEDHGNKDDDLDGKDDKWVYKYDPAADTVRQEHFENGVLQADSVGPAAPPTRPFTFGDLLPKNPRNDDPTLAAGPARGACGESGQPCCERPMIPVTPSVPLIIDSYIANDGPTASALADVLVTVEAPVDCTVDGAASSIRTHSSVLVSTTIIEKVTDTLQITCDPGLHVFTLTSSVIPTGPGVADPESSDDESITTLTVEAKPNIGGTTELRVDDSAASAESADSFGGSTLPIAAAAGGALIAVAIAGLYVRRRLVR